MKTGFKESRIQGFEGSRIQGFEDSRDQGVRGPVRVNYSFQFQNPYG